MKMEFLDKLDQIFVFLGINYATKLVFLYINYKKRPSKAECVGRISRMTLFPVKSLQGIELQTGQVTQKGLKYLDEPLFDRSFMVVNKDGFFKTARAIPKMISIKTRLERDCLVLECDGMTPLRLPKTFTIDENRALIKTDVFGQKVEGLDCGDEAAEWISTCLQKPGHRIIYNTDGIMQRELRNQPTKTFWNQNAKPGDRAIFHDNYPFNMATLSSLDELNTRCGKSLPMDRFRPNFVVEGSSPFDEDNWDEVWIGGVKFTNIRPCDRCILTTIDTDQSKFDPTDEPLKTLRTFRLSKTLFQEAPLFGINLVLDGDHYQHVNVGDPVYVLRKQC